MENHWQQKRRNSSNNNPMALLRQVEANETKEENANRKMVGKEVKKNMNESIYFRVLGLQLSCQCDIP